MDHTDLLDVKVEKTGREYPRVPRATVLRWFAEKRLSPNDWVRPSGSTRWMKVSLAPELADRTTAATGLSSVERSGDSEVTSDVGIDAPAKSGRRRRKRFLEDTALDMTPMIDVTFQLLIFFMFTNQMANPSPMVVPTAHYGRGVSPEGMQTLLLDERGRFYLGENAKEENISPSLDDLINEVTRNAEQVDHPLDVIVGAHKDSKHLQLRILMERLGKVPNVGTVRLGVEEDR